MSATAAGTELFAPINISTATTTTLVAAVTGKSIVVDHLSFCMSGTTPTAKVQDGAGTALTGVMDLAGIYTFDGDRLTPLMSTGKGQSLQIITTGTPSVRGFVSYHLEDAQ